jgi:hypothetical protein
MWDPSLNSLQLSSPSAVAAVRMPPRSNTPRTVNWVSLGDDCFGDPFI